MSNFCQGHERRLILYFAGRLGPLPPGGGEKKGSKEGSDPKQTLKIYSQIPQVFNYCYIAILPFSAIQSPFILQTAWLLIIGGNPTLCGGCALS